MSTHFVIIGNGAAGYRAAKDLRRADGDAQVSIMTDERYPFYLRRQLGDFLAGNLTLPELIFQSRNAYRRERIDLFLMTRITSVEPGAHEVVFSTGLRVRYDRLLIATGTQAVPFEIPGTDLAGVVTFDTLTQAQEARRFLGDVRQAAILGEGIVGLTLTESLVSRGVKVAQLMRGERFWPEMLDEQTSGLVEALLEENGVVLRPNASPRAIIGAGGRAIGVELSGDEAPLPAELVAVGCRRRPAVDLLQGSGIKVGRGVQVDAALRTSHADVYAAGDVAEPLAYDEFGEEGAIFCWQRAWAQGGVAAAGMLDRKAEPALEAVRVRTVLFGRDLAVIGRGHLPQGGNVKAVELADVPGVFRRLVFEDDLLIGAVVFGTGESVHELNRLVARHAPREIVETDLELGVTGAGPDALTDTFARHCPICAAELVIRAGTPAGTVMQCPSCNTHLVVRWDGQRGWLDVNPP